MSQAARKEARGRDPAPARPVHAFDRPPRAARLDPELSATAYRVLATIEAHCYGDRRECWPSNRTIGEQSGRISPETVRRALRELEARGYLAIRPDPTKARGQRLTPLYDLAGPTPPGPTGLVS